MKDQARFGGSGGVGRRYSPAEMDDFGKAERRYDSESERGYRQGVRTVGLGAATAGAAGSAYTESRRPTLGAKELSNDLSRLLDPQLKLRTMGGKNHPGGHVLTPKEAERLKGLQDLKIGGRARPNIFRGKVAAAGLLGAGTIAAHRKATQDSNNRRWN